MCKGAPHLEKVIKKKKGESSFFLPKPHRKEKMASQDCRTEIVSQNWRADD